MNATPEAHNLFGSPKRKRGESAPGIFSPVVSPSGLRLETNIQGYPFSQVEGEEGDGSPRTTVAGKLDKLALQNNFGVSEDHDTHARKRFAQMSRGNDTAAQVQPDPPNQTSFQPPTAETFAFEAKQAPAILDRPQRQTFSPRLDGEPDDNFWRDCEITGHNPSDPNDDGYGINGIGFIPTPAMAHARSQKRKQQIAEYKSREAREARQRRSERRRVVGDQSNSDPGPVGSPKTGGRVRFEDR